MFLQGSEKCTLRRSNFALQTAHFNPNKIMDHTTELIKCINRDNEKITQQ